MSGRGSRGRPSQATLDNITVPTQIKCQECNKNLVAARFSNNQVKKYQESIYKKGTFNAERPRCRNCVGINGVEGFDCSDCGLNKSRELFSANALRKNPDNAVCWECQQRISDQEAHVEDAIKEAEIEENYHRNGASAFNLSGMGSSLPSASKKASNDTASDAGTDNSGKVWITQPVSTGGRASAPRGRTQQNTSDENHRLRSSSEESSTTTTTNTTTRTTTSNGTWAGYGDGDSRRVGESHTSRPADKWAKQGAVKKNAVEKAMAAVERSQGAGNEQLQRDSDDDNSDDFEM